MRSEIIDFMRMSERLLGMALRSNELSQDECDIIAYYAHELQVRTAALCSKHKCESSD